MRRFRIGSEICVLACCAVLVLNPRARCAEESKQGSNRYYVSCTGDDNSDGLSEKAAWRTAAKVNSGKFAPGDQILFQRGGEWHEQLVANSDGVEGNPIVFGDYGDASAAKPTFWGSDIIPAIMFTDAGKSIYTFPIAALPTGKVYYVFADHQFLAASTDSVNLPAHSFFIDGATVYVNTGGTDPRTDKTVYSASDRASGTNADSSLICSNGHNNLIFKNLVGRETAATPSGGGVPDAYVFRIQSSSNVRLENCEAFNGGKHHIGVINSTGFVGKNLLAEGCIPGLSFGFAGAFVSFSDESRHGDTSQWIDCKVDHFDPNQTSFITHGPGLGNLLIQNLSSVGCNIAIGTDGPGEVVNIKGGLLTGPTCDLYGTGIIVDGLHINGDAKIDVFGNKNTVENCVDDGSTNEQGSIVVRGQGNIIRSNTLNHRAAHGPCIDLKPSATSTQLIDNKCIGPANTAIGLSTVK